MALSFAPITLPYWLSRLGYEIQKDWNFITRDASRTLCRIAPLRLSISSTRKCSTKSINKVNKGKLKQSGRSKPSRKRRKDGAKARRSQAEIVSPGQHASERENARKTCGKDTVHTITRSTHSAPALSTAGSLNSVPASSNVLFPEPDPGPSVELAAFNESLKVANNIFRNFHREISKSLDHMSFAKETAAPQSNVPAGRVVEPVLHCPAQSPTTVVQGAAQCKTSSDKISILEPSVPTRFDDHVTPCIAEVSSSKLPAGSKSDDWDSCYPSWLSDIHDPDLRHKVGRLLESCSLFPVQSLYNLLLDHRGDFESARDYLFRLMEEYLQSQIAQKPVVEQNEAELKAEDEEVRVRFDFDDPFFIYDDDVPEETPEQRVASHRYQSPVKPTKPRKSSNTKGPPKQRQKRSGTSTQKCMKSKRRNLKQPKTGPNQLQNPRSGTDSPTHRLANLEDANNSQVIATDSEDDDLPLVKISRSRLSEPSHGTTSSRKRKRTESPMDSSSGDSNFIEPDETVVSDWSTSFHMSESSGESSDWSRCEQDLPLESDSEREPISEPDSSTDDEEDLSIELDNPFPHLQSSASGKLPKVRRRSSASLTKADNSSTWARICARTQRNKNIDWSPQM
ncbi:uncharacterized protein EI97DRAFT_464606 [Westerdykella ornata]|uniref:Uncharacterized protein n=1 Tax=Westerdykella ornata TaxID=318751 RepID=A0A6A6JSS5_WESOR|nr:uncharacterized protein EI97DRAFT_464606 [Westerdykella ornata]KAF2279315.1 hypothetical protein EI97DRAFT_464606 [Westerdykella ornata]